MATSTSHKTESMAPPTTAEKSQAKHPRGRGGKWVDVLGKLSGPQRGDTEVQGTFLRGGLKGAYARQMERAPD